MIRRLAGRGHPIAVMALAFTLILLTSQFVWAAQDELISQQSTRRSMLLDREFVIEDSPSQPSRYQGACAPNQGSDEEALAVHLAGIEILEQFYGLNP